MSKVGAVIRSEHPKVGQSSMGQVVDDASVEEEAFGPMWTRIDAILDG